jgi:hypothetical protein
VQWLGSYVAKPLHTSVIKNPAVLAGFYFGFCFLALFFGVRFCFKRAEFIQGVSPECFKFCTIKRFGKVPLVVVGQGVAFYKLAQFVIVFFDGSELHFFVWDEL